MASLRIAVTLAMCTLLAACAVGTRPPSTVATKDRLVRISASPQDKRLLDRLQADFNTLQPQIRFEQALHGPESTLAGVYAGTTDLALLARELREPLERMAFEWVMLDKPLVITIADAGLRSDRISSQLGVFVHRDNPVEQLSLAQLDAIFGAEHRRSSANLRDWNQVNTTFPATPIVVVGPSVDSIEGIHFRRAVLKDSRKWNPAYRQLPDAGAVVESIASTPAAIGIAPLRAATVDLKLLALSDADGGPYRHPTEETIAERSYPLLRSISVVPAHSKAKPLADPARQFLHYLLSDRGQAIIAVDGSYLPLSDRARQTQRERLP